MLGNDTTSAAVHDELNLYILQDKYIIEPIAKKNNFLVIDRVSEEIYLSTENNINFHNVLPQKIFGIWGIIQLASGLHLIVIKSRKCVGDLFGHFIWQIDKSEILPFSRSTLHLNEAQQEDNKVFLSMLDFVLSTEYFYYSTSYDLTHSMQRLCETSPDFLHLSLIERADERFVWNYFLLNTFMQQKELNSFCIPIMHGFVSIKTCYIKGRSFDYCLISRRSRFRAGLRYYMRGVDEYGYSANNVETEQIVQAEGHRFAFVQTRGSVPLFWNQYPNLLYKPTPKMLPDNSVQREAFEKHFNDQIYAHQYGQQVIINLLDDTGKEKKLNRDFSVSAQTAELPSVTYIPFDFHRECRRMQWHRLSILVDRVKPYLDSFGFLHLQPEDDNNLNHLPLSSQLGVFRTNCIDCLDRTNVVQSLLARCCMQKQLQKLGWLTESEQLETFLDFEDMFKNVWADNADLLAKQYTGTGALKTDFTRTGHRTKLGMLRDLWNSSIRYIYNNFYDGQRQDAIDLFLGNWVPERAKDASVLRPERDWKTTAIPVVLFISLGMCMLCILLPPEHWTEQFMYLLFWGAWLLVSIFMLFFYGMEFVDSPKLALKVKVE